jgi:hypothetical protein
MLLINYKTTECHSSLIPTFSGSVMWRWWISHPPQRRPGADAVAVEVAMRGEVCGGSGGKFGGGSGGIGIGSGDGDGDGGGSGKGEGEGRGVGDEGGGGGGGEGKAAAVVVELAAAVVVAMVVEVEVAVAGGVPFGPPNEIKIKSMLDNMLVHLI